jgi:hypothetical protein
MTAMTSRHVICLAMIVAALLTLDARVAPAALSNCTVYPDACKYGAHGLLWFLPNGSLRARPRAGSGSSSWGCGATDGRVKGGSYGYGNRAAASYRALAECARRTAGGGGCHIISCSASIHSQAEAVSAWFNRR